MLKGDGVYTMAAMQVPIVAALTPLGEIVTTNTVAVALAEDGKTINFLFAPDDNKGSITIIRPIV